MELALSGPGERSKLPLRAADRFPGRQGILVIVQTSDGLRDPYCSLYFVSAFTFAYPILCLCFVFLLCFSALTLLVGRQVEHPTCKN